MHTIAHPHVRHATCQERIQYSILAHTMRQHSVDMPPDSCANSTAETRSASLNATSTQQGFAPMRAQPHCPAAACLSVPPRVFVPLNVSLLGARARHELFTTRPSSSARPCPDLRRRRCFRKSARPYTPPYPPCLWDIFRRSSHLRVRIGRRRPTSRNLGLCAPCVRTDLNYPIHFALVAFLGRHRAQTRPTQSD